MMGSLIGLSKAPEPCGIGGADQGGAQAFVVLFNKAVAKFNGGIVGS